MAHPVTISATTPDLEIDRINLSHLLQRLERNFHEPDAQRSPLQSVYHRRRVEAVRSLFPVVQDTTDVKRRASESQLCANTHHAARKSICKDQSARFAA